MGGLGRGGQKKGQMDKIKGEGGGGVGMWVWLEWGGGMGEKA